METTVEQTILDQLNQTRVNGFPLMKYIGAKSCIFGAGWVSFKVAKNPEGITEVGVHYLVMHDSYKIYYFKGDSIANSQRDLYFDDFDSIARELGVL